MILSVLPDILWLIVAVYALLISTIVATGISETLKVTNSDKHVIFDWLRNGLTVYKTRIGLIVNNIFIGLTAILGMAHIVNIPYQLFGLYFLISLLAGEASFIFLAHRDLKLIK